MPRGRRSVGVTAAAPTAASLPWAEALKTALASRLGDSAQRDGIIDKLTHSLAESTANAYAGHLQRFVDFCASQPDAPSPLPATTDTVLRWLEGDVCAGGKVQADSLQPYLSAINRIHRDLGFDEPALGHLVLSYKAGLAMLRASSGARSAERVFLPPSVVERTLEWALEVELSGASTATLSLFRAAVATVFTYCFFARGATGAALLCKHVRRGPDGSLLITLDHEKGKAKRKHSRLLTVPAGAVPGLDQLLFKWERLRGTARDDDSYYALASERAAAGPRSTRWRSTQIDAWLQLVLEHMGVSPPAGEKWTGHSLRKGAASSSNAIGVSLDRICWCGGWSILSKAVHDYIDPTCPSSPAAYRFFGWLLPAAMRI